MLLVASLLLALLMPAASAGARARPTFRGPTATPRTVLSANGLYVGLGRPDVLALPKDLPGVPLPASPFSDIMNIANPYDVFSIDLAEGDTLDLSFTGDPGTNFEALVFFNPPGVAVSLDDEDVLPVWGTWGTNDEDGTGYPQEMQFVAGTAGTYSLVFAPRGQTAPGGFTCSWSKTPPPISMKRIAGKTRYETALAISQEAFADGSATHTILAQGTGFADALAAAALAGSYDCPILLTPPTSISTSLVAEIDRLRGGEPTITVWIVGGTKSVSASIATSLTLHGAIEVKRLEGANRFGTAIEIGKEVKRHEEELGRPWTGEVFVTRGDTYPDALAAAPIAFARKMPVILVNKASIPDSTTAGLPDLELTKAYILGDTNAVSAWVATHLGTPAVPYERFQGTGANANRMGTAVDIADKAITKGWASAETVGITTGWAFPDALGGGALIGRAGGVLLLTKPTEPYGWLSDPPWYFVNDHAVEVENMRAFGSNKSVPDPVFGDFLYALDFHLP